MNIYAVIILVTILSSYLLNFITDILNLKALKSELPDEFAGVYDEKAYANSQEYTRVNTGFGFITSTLSLIVSIVFWFSGGFNWLDQITRSWQFGSIVTGLIYIGILILFKGIISLPFSYYATFVIEERFGFNKTTKKTFLTDIIKGVLLSFVIGAPVLAGVLYFFESAGNLAWFYCWIGATGIVLFLQFIAPTWIMPLFNKFNPLEAGTLKEKIMQFAQSVKFPLQGIFVMDGSKRSSKSNAFFTGFGKNKRIVLFDTLIQKQTEDELLSVLAHEIGHYKKKHIIQGMVISIAHLGVMFFLLSIFLNHKGLFDAFYMEQMSIYAGLLFFGMLFSPIELLLSILMQIFSRKNEFEADRFAAQNTGTGKYLIDALKKLSRDNLSNLTPHPWYVFLNYSHPPVLKRIEALKRKNTDTIF